MSLTHFHDTIAAVSTAEGRSALGIVRISGPNAIKIVSKIVSEPENLLVARGGSSIYRKIYSPSYEAERNRRGLGGGSPDVGSSVSKHTTTQALPLDEEGELIDDVVIHVFRAPRSFTGEDLCEITTHGSPVIVRQVLAVLVAQGAREAEPGEFSRRAFFNGKIGIEDAELISIKANANSEQELRGSELALHEKFERLRNAYNKLIALIALVDAEIDFGDSDQIQIKDFEDRVDEVIGSLNELVRDSSTRGENAGYFTVALTGPPNVGKSSVFNALLNFERSIVSETPGTTRDYVEAFINIDGFRVKLIDTAGIREAEESIEAQGIAMGTNAALHADISLRVTGPCDRTPHLTNGSILLHNKTDLDGWQESLNISALTGEGIEELHQWLSSELRKRSSEFNQINLSESEKIKLESIIDGLKSLKISLEPALLAEELRNLASDLASLLGMNVSEDSLSYIFSKMCIGK
jgi:tRNA modification GTPase